jgi:hypothetical protein
MERELNMLFVNSSNENVIITLSNVKAGLTAPEIKAVMAKIITNNIFDTPGGDLASMISADLVTTDKQSISLS